MCNGLWQNKIVRVGKTSGPVLSRLWTKVLEILRQCRRPFALPTPLPDCLCHVSFSRYWPLSVEVVKKSNKFLAPNFFREGWPQLFYGILLERPTVDRLTKCGWVPFADLHLRSLAMKQNCQNYGGWVKMAVEFEAVCGSKFMTFWDDVGDPL